MVGLSLLAVSMKQFLFALPVLIFVGGCTSAGRIPPVTPQSLSASADQSVKGQDFTWGGSILSLRNLKEHTQVEVMAYPLDDNGRPDAGGSPLGRFLVDYPGFLEPAEYRSGLLLTVTGPLLGYTDGKVGKADYRYPALRADQLKLWPKSVSTFKHKPNMNFGVGFGSGGYSSIGIGIGF
ncbi:MAG TPA: hypothetical protein ENG92_06285 [Thiolapillus brandeum]|uniref:Slp family lipoprotein n=1 Tax=Thiolapillus brandeum TaxID=1076588 RepID=A0A831NYT4_9GAMM|nr:hypothetical protein [Thiolapillus brandeum]